MAPKMSKREVQALSRQGVPVAGTSKRPVPMPVTAATAAESSQPDSLTASVLAVAGKAMPDAQATLAVEDERRGPVLEEEDARGEKRRRVTEQAGGASSGAVTGYPVHFWDPNFEAERFVDAFLVSPGARLPFMDLGVPGMFHRLEHQGLEFALKVRTLERVVASRLVRAKEKFEEESKKAVAALRGRVSELEAQIGDVEALKARHCLDVESFQKQLDAEVAGRAKVEAALLVAKAEVAAAAADAKEGEARAEAAIAAARARVEGAEVEIGKMKREVEEAWSKRDELKGEAVLQYAEGYWSAVSHARFVAPDVDFSALGPFKEVAGGRLVDAEEENPTGRAEVPLEEGGDIPGELGVSNPGSGVSVESASGAAL